MPLSLRGAALLASTMALVLGAPMAARAADAVAGQPAQMGSSLSPSQVAEVEALIAAWVARHPDMLRQAMYPVRAAVEVEAEDGVLGIDTARVTIAAFIDRGTAVGSLVVQHLAALAASAADVRAIIKKMPLLPQSVAVAQAVAAARMQGQEAAGRFEVALTTQAETPDRAAITAAAVAAKLDLERFAKDCQGDDGMRYLRRIRAQAEYLGVSAAPTLLIGTHALVGMQTMDDLRAAVAEARQSSY